ncbi:MAG: cell wall-active antibiotics response protein [Anaerolineales bacterium]|nr:cell wall-active antibiotics response protein [Anaerolineales bacterium]
MEHRRPSLIGPLILITIGVLFLLANLGYLPLSFWEIAFRFWPLILILIGLEIIIGKRSIIGGLIVVVLWCAVIAGILWLSISSGGMFVSSAAITDQINQPLGEISSATIDLNIGVATANVTALGTDTADLMKGTFRHAEGMQIGKTFNMIGSEGRLALRETGTSSWMPFGTGEARWDLALNPTIPIALRINGGIGRAELDLTALTITALNVDAGVGTIRVNAPQTGSVTMRLKGGVGDVRVMIPSGVAARIRVDKGLGALRVNEARFPKSGNAYQSADFATAPNKVDIEVDGGVGSVEIR